MSRRKKQRKNHKIWDAFSSHHGDNKTKIIQSRTRASKDGTFILTSRQKRVFYPLLPDLTLPTTFNGEMI